MVCLVCCKQIDGSQKVSRIGKRSCESSQEVFQIGKSSSEDFYTLQRRCCGYFKPSEG